MPNVKKLPLDYSKARGSLESLVPVPAKFLDADWLKGLRASAFTIAGIENARVLANVIESLSKALEDGSTFKTWRDNLDIAEIEDFTSSRLETIFRTNIQTAYEQGNVEAAADISDTHPYFIYSAVLDSRTRPTHAARDGTILPQDDDFWVKNTPPIDYNCRCSLIAITEDEAGTRGGVTKKKEAAKISSDAPLSKGWDHDKRNVGRKLNKIFRDAADELPTELRKEFEKHFEKKGQVADVWLEKNKKELGLKK